MVEGKKQERIRKEEREEASYCVYWLSFRSDVLRLKARGKKSRGGMFMKRNLEGERQARAKKIQSVSGNEQKRIVYLKGC